MALAQDAVLQTFERTILRAKLLVDNLKHYKFCNVLIKFHAPTRILKKAICLEDTVATVEETGFLYVSLGNLTSNIQRIKWTPFGGRQHHPWFWSTKQSIRLLLSSKLKINTESNKRKDTSSEYSSSSEFEFLSSTDPSEPGLTEHEVKNVLIRHYWHQFPALKRTSTKFETYFVRPRETRSKNFSPSLMTISWKIGLKLVIVKEQSTRSK